MNDDVYWSRVGEHGHLAMKPTSNWLTNYIKLLEETARRNLEIASKSDEGYLGDTGWR